MIGRSIAGLAVGVLVVVTTGCRAPADGTAAATVVPAHSPDTEIVPVIRRDVVEEQKAEARVGNGPILTLPLEVEGIVTAAPQPGTVLGSGDVVVEVGGRPVVLVIGESTLYRPLRLVGAGERDEAGTRLGRLTGTDVAQLQQFLLDEGFDDNGRLSVDEEFGRSTERAVEDWQRAVGHPATGIVDASQMIFMTTDLLVESRLTVGQRFGQFDVTGTETVLEIDGSTTLREFFAVGSTVEVLSDPPVTGVVTRSTRITGELGVQQLIEVTVTGADRDALGQAVEVVGSVTRANDVLTIPVRALLATSDGDGWQVEVDAGSGPQPVAVELIDVVDTTAIVSGLRAGDQVVVPL